MFEATNRECAVLIGVIQARILIADVQSHVVGVVATALSGTPEVSDVTLIVEVAIVVSATSGERRETVGVRTIAITSPASQRLELLACSTFPAHCGKQLAPFRGIRQVPSFRTHATHLAEKAANMAIATIIFRPAYRCNPHVETTVLGAIAFIFIASATTPAIFCFIVQVLRHPGLFANFDSIVSLAITGVQQLSVLTVVFRFGFATYF